jgi:hypothetical protein
MFVYIKGIVSNGEKLKKRRRKSYAIRKNQKEAPIVH